MYDSLATRLAKKNTTSITDVGATEDRTIWGNRGGRSEALLTFAERFAPFRGDMIFGLSSEIKQYRSWWAVFSRRADYVAAIFTRDIMTALQSEAINIPGGPYTLSAYQAVQKGRGALTGQEKEAVTEYERYLSGVEKRLYDAMEVAHNGRFCALRNHILAEKYAGYLKSHKRYGFMPTFIKHGQGHYEEKNEMIVRKTLSKYVSRGSKAALEMLLHSPGDEQIHFILDGISIDQVIGKENVGGNGLPSVTASELRYLYRNRNYLNNRVYFYRHGQEVIPPWEQEGNDWKKYMPKLKSK